MKRPLCMFSLVFIAAVFLMLKLFPIPLYKDKEADKSMLEITGQVYAKEQKGDTNVIYLKSKSDRLICYMEGSYMPRMGSYVTIKGKYKGFSTASNPGQFNQKKYYQILNLNFSILNANIIQETKEYNRFKEAIYKIRRTWANSYERCMHTKEAGVLKAMILGDKSELDADLKNLYKQAGISHILAISGLHISIIGMGVYKLFKKVKLPISMAALISLFVMILYGELTSAGTSSIRAIFMFGMYLGAQVVKRTYDMLTALSLAAVFLIIEQPLYLYHTGFLLSFGAVLGIGLCCPIFEQITPKKLKKNKIVKNFLPSISVTFFSLPIMAWYFFELPVYSIFINLVVIPLMTSLLVLGICGGIAGIFLEQAGILLLLPCQWILNLYEGLCKALEMIPFHTFVIGKPSVLGIVLFYLIILILLIKYRKLKTHTIGLCILAAMLCICIRFPAKTEITMLDIGQGDCIYIHEEGGVDILMDGGSSDISKVGTYRMIPFLKSKGVSKIDYAFISHLDSDHYNGILECLEMGKNGGIRIDNIVLSTASGRGGTKEKKKEYEILCDAAKKVGCNVIYISRGDVLKYNRLELKCLHPADKAIYEDSNAASLVFLLQYDTFKMLFTGDIGINEEQLLYVQQSDVLKTGHHGSNYSSSEEFLNRLSPQMALISCGKNNRYGHPGKDAVSRLERQGIEVYITTKCGAISIYPAKEGYGVRTFYDR